MEQTPKRERRKRVSFDTSKNEFFNVEAKAQILFDEIAEDLAYTLADRRDDFEIVVERNTLDDPVRENLGGVEVVDFPKVKDNPFIIKDREGRLN